MNLGQRPGRLRSIATVLIGAVVVFVLVATIVEAVRQDSWGPVWTVGWLPAVLVASVYRRGQGKACGPRLGGRTRS